MRFVSGKPKKNSECIDLTYARKDIQEHNRTHKKPFINPPTPLAARGAAGGACQRKNYKQRGARSIHHHHGVWDWRAHSFGR